MEKHFKISERFLTLMNKNHEFKFANKFTGSLPSNCDVKYRCDVTRGIWCLHGGREKHKNRKISCRVDCLNILTHCRRIILDRF